MEQTKTGRQLEEVRGFEDFGKKMELQDHQLKSDWSRYFCNQPPVQLDTSANHHLFYGELRSNPVRLEGGSDPYCSIWMDTEPARFKSCNSRSFAMDARIRLDNLKSGSNSPLPYCAMDGTMYRYNCQEDLWDSEPREEESALDLVELLDVEDDVEDEERWLYESPKKQVVVEKTESALRWCRHVLDNPSPEMEAACCHLIHRLDQRSSSQFYRRPAVFHHTANATVGSPMDKSSTVSTTQSTSGSLDNNELSITHDSINTNYRLADITDVHIMARIQEASLRKDYVSTPVAASPQKSPESPMMLPSYFNTTAENIDDFTPGNKAEASSSSGLQPGLSSLSSYLCQSPTSVAKQNCQSPKLARLQQQVTQFKLLKLAQNQGVSSTRMGSSCWSPSLSAASMNSSVSLHSGKGSSIRVPAMKRVQRSQSLSPCRIPHPAKGYLTVCDRVFASPERPTTVAWARNAPSAQRRKTSLVN
ncbi:SLAIN motif-containing protein-like protein [Lates japonicus]|uniref:SLAIN motif-containing protein-like protein n=1 Tax=Lates japonicus TaxID=270547 RepID=A0AAD3QW19_LATJO|nr:SLAIN motif-containing protein-like protein [Lates japonicus]